MRNSKLFKYIKSIHLVRKIYFGFKGGFLTLYATKKRLNLNIFDYKELSKPLAIYPSGYVQENSLYGHDFIINQFVDVTRKDTLIEHGLCYGSYVAPYLKDYKTIITFSEYRKKYIEKKIGSKNIVVIGPYIQYAKILYSTDRMNSLKKDLGNVLLVFPCHSIDTSYADYGIDLFIEKIKKIRDEHNFDNVLVCMYWKDIELATHKNYEEAGFLIVTAGHINDKYFMNRLKTIISLADVVITNDIGTHVGYCVSMDKPLQIISDDPPKYIAGEGDKEDIDKELNIYQGKDLEARKLDVDVIRDCFSEYSESLTDEQRLCIEYFWGK